MEEQAEGWTTVGSTLQREDSAARPTRRSSLQAFEKARTVAGETLAVD
jgi:hypothetical protein